MAKSRKANGQILKLKNEMMRLRRIKMRQMEIRRLNKEVKELKIATGKDIKSKVQRAIARAKTPEAKARVKKVAKRGFARFKKVVKFIADSN